MGLYVAKLQAYGLMTMRGEWTAKGERAIARVEIAFAERPGETLSMEAIEVEMFREEEEA